ncbi:MAG: sulfurtransferase [Tissierellia bacterium]|nr:sulfurtransferase [Tissierellia bacterium]
MKKGFILFLSLLLIFLSACGSQEPATIEEGEQVEEAKEETKEEETSSAVPAVDKKKVYVSPEWLKSVIDGGQPESADYVLWSCNWGTEEDNKAYSDGHIPTAVHMNTDNIEEPENWNIRNAEEITQFMKDFGVTKDTTVIVYSDNVNGSADDRVAFMALWAGVENVKALDGGLEAWLASDYELETGSNKPTPTDKDFGVAIPAHPEYILTMDQVKDKLANDPNFKLVSIRSKEEFDGITSGYGYMDKAGEPKGAIWGRDTDDGSYASPDKKTVGPDVIENYLKDYDASLDNELSFYCGTGWRAAIPFLILYENGYTNINMYDGGWFVWLKDDANEVQVGDPKSGDVKYTTVGELETGKAKK